DRVGAEESCPRRQVRRGGDQGSAVRRVERGGDARHQCAVHQSQSGAQGQGAAAAPRHRHQSQADEPHGRADAEIRPAEDARRSVQACVCALTASMPPSGTVLRVSNLHKSYAAAGGTTVALNGVDLAIEAGSFVSIVGPSGCGKSTLLQIMAGLTTATSGDVFCGSARVQEPPRDVVYVLQQYTRSLFPWKT